MQVPRGSMQWPFVLLVLLTLVPVTVQAQTATHCEGGSWGDICYDWWDESNNARDYVEGWFVERNITNGDYAECFVHANLWTRYIVVQWCRSWRGNQRVGISGGYADPAWFHPEAPVDDRQWGGVRCNDREGQNRLFGDKLFGWIREGVGIGVGEAARGAFWAGGVAWQKVFGYGLIYIHTNFMLDYSGYFWQCYVRY